MENANLLSLKDSYPYLLQESLKYAKGQSSKLRHAIE